MILFKPMKFLSMTIKGTRNLLTTCMPQVQAWVKWWIACFERVRGIMHPFCFCFFFFLSFIYYLILTLDFSTSGKGYINIVWNLEKALFLLWKCPLVLISMWGEGSLYVEARGLCGEVSSQHVFSSIASPLFWDRISHLVGWLDWLVRKP